MRKRGNMQTRGQARNEPFITVPLGVEGWDWVWNVRWEKDRNGFLHTPHMKGFSMDLFCEKWLKDERYLDSKWWWNFVLFLGERILQKLLRNHICALRFGAIRFRLFLARDARCDMGLIGQSFMSFRLCTVRHWNNRIRNPRRYAILGRHLYVLHESFYYMIKLTPSNYK